MKNILNTKEKDMKAITLIALVITIIILLILAGITINTLSNNGIFEKAKEARGKWQNAQNEEEMQIAKYSNEIDSYVGGNREIQRTLLWTNPNPNLPLEGNGNLNLSSSLENYSHVAFIWKISTTDANVYEDIAKIEPDRILKNGVAFYSLGVTLDSGNNCFVRLFNTLNNTTISHGNCFVVNGGGTNNNLAIPISIYGINI